jgi:hypothetical protein
MIEAWTSYFGCNLTGVFGGEIEEGGDGPHLIVEHIPAL